MNKKETIIITTVVILTIEILSLGIYRKLHRPVQGNDYAFTHFKLPAGYMLPYDSVEIYDPYNAHCEAVLIQDSYAGHGDTLHKLKHPFSICNDSLWIIVDDIDTISRGCIDTFGKITAKPSAWFADTAIHHPVFIDSNGNTIPLASDTIKYNFNDVIIDSTTRIDQYPHAWGNYFLQIEIFDSVEHTHHNFYKGEKDAQFTFPPIKDSMSVITGLLQMLENNGNYLQKEVQEKDSAWNVANKWANTLRWICREYGITEDNIMQLLRKIGYTPINLYNKKEKKHL